MIVFGAVGIVQVEDTDAVSQSGQQFTGVFLGQQSGVAYGAIVLILRKISR